MLLYVVYKIVDFVLTLWQTHKKIFSNYFDQIFAKMQVFLMAVCSIEIYLSTSMIFSKTETRGRSTPLLWTNELHNNSQIIAPKFNIEKGNFDCNYYQYF